MSRIQKSLYFFVLFFTMAQCNAPQNVAKPEELSNKQRLLKLSTLYCKKQQLLQKLFSEFEKLPENHKQRKDELFQQSIMLLQKIAQNPNKKPTEKEIEKRKATETLIFETLCTSIQKEQSELFLIFPKIEKLLQEIHKVDAEIKQFLQQLKK